EKTLSRLGGPVHASLAIAKQANADSDYGSTASNPYIFGSVYPAAFNGWSGNVMVTEGYSYQESFGPNALISGGRDLRLAGKASVLLGSPGDVHIAADGDAAISDFAANSGSDSDFTSGGRWRTFNKTEHAIDTTLTAIKTVLSVTAAIA